MIENQEVGPVQPGDISPQTPEQLAAANEEQSIQKALIVRRSDLENFHRELQGSTELTESELKEYEDFAFAIFALTDKLQIESTRNEVIESLQRIKPLSEEVKAAISAGIESARKRVEARELRKQMFTELAENFIKTLIDRGYSGSDLYIQAELLTDSKNFLSSDHMRKVVQEQLKERGLDTFDDSEAIE